MAREPLGDGRATVAELTPDATALPAWDTAPVRDRALRHSVTDYVLDALQEGRLAPGARVHETSLARALGVSLTPVREALFRLADQGVLEHRPRRGFYVRELGEPETRDIYTFRALLEGFAARAVVERRCRPGGAHPDDEDGFAALAALIEQGKRAGEAADRQAVAACNARFHDQLVRLARHSLLARSWALLAPAEWLLVPTWTWQLEPITGAEVRDWVARHERLLELLRGEDAPAAEREASEHARTAGQENVRRRFPSTAAGAELGER